MTLADRIVIGVAVAAFWLGMSWYDEPASFPEKFDLGMAFFSVFWLLYSGVFSDPRGMTVGMGIGNSSIAAGRDFPIAGIPGLLSVCPYIRSPGTASIWLGVSCGCA